jgi:hypothetical protein
MGMAQDSTENQSGGVNIHGGTVNTEGGDIVGRDKVMTKNDRHLIEEALGPLSETISTLSEERRATASAMLEDLKREISKADKRNDGVLAKLIDGLVGLIPAAASAVVSAFGTPILAAVAGPVTKVVLERLKGSNA